ncbi:Putative ureidoglycolate lyase, rmlC-like cupin domain superfamily [Septoria linicola]|uniref:Ureidoglycolate lyase, rmlC-like cupin domain superfamily n=1 Tax=Septoria linicola TaxID=215465 RepID=A0A9Q9ERU9_9PEZI|nr:putative ureidoglycolate lyase, rmlC-like cupin domain superfamily [Septoria linicola]USW58938.1 Putative ureidoglycolate lyase, rmlC-like cupin domain superfamily [Septoria linicola]
MRSQAPSLTISPAPLTPEAFSPFGEVIQNPATHDELDGNGQWRLQHQIANQGSATKWLDVTHMNNHYDRASSRKAAKVVMNMFVCKPRELSAGKEHGKKVFRVGILERHPYTPQTFVPMGVGKEDKGTSYLVIVAPTLPAKSKTGQLNEKPYPAEKPQRKRSLKERLLGARPSPYSNDHIPTTTTPSSQLPAPQRPKGTGMPDLQNLRAFIAKGDQAVTYGPGTWHAPMVVLGEKDIDFVVVQYANGVGNEDCQECELDTADDDGLVVEVGLDCAADAVEAAKPGYMRAKL